MVYQSKYHNTYLDADKYVLYNDGDIDLTPIVLSLPDPPDYKYIDGYGDLYYKQKFKRHELPPRLKELEDKAEKRARAWADKRSERTMSEYRVIEEFWNILDNERDSYLEEIAYIKRVHWHLYYGYWFFNKGKPTWIPPKYYRYLNFWYITDKKRLPDGRVKYRDVDRRTYIFKYYMETTTETFKDVDKDGVAVKNEHGVYDMVDTGHRTFLGHIKPKRRREGATNQAFNDMLYTAERTYKGDCTIIADKGGSAEDLFKAMLIPSWLKQPLFLKPKSNVKIDSNKISMTPPSTEYGTKYLGSVIDYINTSDEGAIDRRKQKEILLDEAGKTVRADVRRRHGVSRKTLMQGDDIDGYMHYPSTVEEMNEGGEVYRLLWDNSYFYKRNVVGQTMSGLGRIFNPAFDGRDNYIDPWGYSVIASPNEDQIKYGDPKIHYYIATNKGAKQLLEEKYTQLLADGTPEAERDYREEVRKDPMRVADCWIGTSGDLGFDLIKISSRLTELSRGKPYETGRLEWTNGFGSDVVFVDDELNGHWHISDVFAEKRNQWTYTPFNAVWNETSGKRERAFMPLDPTLTTMGVDPFDYGTQGDAKFRPTGTRLSDGGIAVFLNYDVNVDGGKEPEEWKTFKFIATYRHRPASLSEFNNEVVKASKYFQAMAAIERNKTRTWEYMIEMGFGGHLIYVKDADGKINDKPGFFALDGNKDNLFNELRDYISMRSHVEQHIDFLKEAKNIVGPERLKDYDLLAACGWAILGSKKGHQKTLERMSNRQIDISGSIISQKAI